MAEVILGAPPTMARSRSDRAAEDTPAGFIVSSVSRRPSFVVSASDEAYLDRSSVVRRAMTHRKRNRLIDLALMALVALITVGTTTVTLAGKF